MSKKLVEIFENNGFQSLISDSNGTRTIQIRAFSNNISENEKEAKYIVPEELMDCFIDSNKAEMYLVFFMNDDWKKNINRWDTRIMTLINFGNAGQALLGSYDEIKKIRYNIFQIYLMSGKVTKEKKREIMTEERATNVSRKLFLRLDENDEVRTNDLSFLPFFFEDVRSKNVSEKQEKIRLSKVVEEVKSNRELQFLLEEPQNSEDGLKLENDRIEALMKWINHEN